MIPLKQPLYFRRAHLNRPGRRSRRGYTLPELLVSIFVISLVTLIVSNLFIGTGRFNRDEQSRINVGEAAARLLAVTDETLRQADDILSGANINGVDYVTAADIIVFTLPSLVSGGPSSTLNDNAVILLVGDQLWLIIDPDAGSSRAAVDRALVTDVADVYFRYNAVSAADADAVTLTVNITETVNGQPFTKSNILYATLRNHS